MADRMTRKEFIDKWKLSELKERSMYVEHFIDICRVVDHPTPAELDPKGERFTFEAGAEKTAGGNGWADVWKREYFAWEYKGPDRDLDEAYNQLLQYRESLENPPLLVVSDHRRFRIHTNWTNTVKRVYEFELEDLAGQTAYNQLRALFHDPHALHPREQADKMTEAAAEKFAGLADELRKEGHAPRNVAHFLTQVVFCLFAEDIGLLPRGPKGEAGIFSEILEGNQGARRSFFPEYTRQLFRSMAASGDAMMQHIRHFNGGLFVGSDFWVPELTSEQIRQLYIASQLDWSSIEPSIFGTLFERGLDPTKRAQIGAHYTSRQDIEAIVEPVLMAPLRREWAAIAGQLPDDATEPGPTPGERQQMRDGFLEKLGSLRVLDPACGSGNFLYVSLGLLKDLEKQVITHPAFEALPEAEPACVTPEQLYGIEISEYAHELASVVVWIGYIQWFRNNGYRYEQTPVLQKLDNIQCKDAILGVREDGTLYKPDWPDADVIVGNPPFLGAYRMRRELGDDYTENLWKLYKGMPPTVADLVTYWFERAREQIDDSKAKRAGLLATNAIRQQDSRAVLERIQQSGDIFIAYSDRAWVLDGAAVRISMVGFDDGTETQRSLDGEPVNKINADLSAGVDLTTAQSLEENTGLSFQGVQKIGSFDIEETLAKRMLEAPTNPNGRPNKDVIKPYYNAYDIVRGWTHTWIIDFGDMPVNQAALYEAPFEYVKEHVKPERDKNRRAYYRDRWWLHGEARPGMNEAVSTLTRFLVTPRVAKHRLFTWVENNVLASNKVIIFAREDDYFFGVLQSKLHEVWSLHLGAWHGKGNDPTYTPTTTFETFPFPWTPGEEPTGDPRYKAIAGAAKELNEKREAWLNPPNAEAATLKARTLTNLYNDRPTWLQNLHEALDRAVFAAYGWDYDELHDAEAGTFDEEEILRRLLALNLERAENQGE